MLLLTIFKICCNFSVNVVFQKCIETPTPRKSLTFCVIISLVDHILHIRTKTWPKIMFKSLLFVKNAFLKFSLQSTLLYKYSKKTFNWSPWACKRFLIKCILILLRIGRKKKELEKWTVITFVKCILSRAITGLYLYLDHQKGILIIFSHGNSISLHDRKQ